MNAATVIGPRSRTKSAISNVQSAIPLFLLDRHEDLVAAIVAEPPDENPRDASRGDLLQLAPGFHRARHGHAVDRQDDVTRPQAPRRIVIRIDVRDDGAALAR